VHLREVSLPGHFLHQTEEEIMKYRIAALGALGLLTAGCNTVTVREELLSTNQRVAMVSSPGDGVSPPTSVVLFEHRRGQYVPVATGFTQAPVTAFFDGAGAGIALGAGVYGAARVAKPSTVSVVQSGGSATASGGSATGGSVSQQ
jgi:hypothetical protein